MDTKIIFPLLLGAGAGAGAAFLVWKFAESKIDQQFAVASGQIVSRAAPQLRTEIQNTLRTQIPPLVEQEMARQLARVNLTPDTGSRISRLLAYGDRLGLYGLRGVHGQRHRVSRVR